MTQDAQSMIDAINLRAAELDAERAAAAAELAEAESKIATLVADNDTKALGNLERRVAELRQVVARAAGGLAVLLQRRQAAEVQLAEQQLAAARREYIELEAQALSGLRASVQQSEALLATWAALEGVARRAGSIGEQHRNEFSFHYAGAGHHPPDWWPLFNRWLTAVRESIEGKAAA